MTKVKVFVYGRRQQRRRGYDNSSPDFRHGEQMKMVFNCVEMFQKDVNIWPQKSSTTHAFQLVQCI